jgi:hypothetical protein
VAEGADGVGGGYDEERLLSVFFGEMTKGLAGRFRDALLAYGEIEGGLLLSRF